MAKKYKIIKIEEEVHQNLIRLRALHEIQTGQRITLSELIDDLIQSQPIWQITAEELEKENSKAQ